MRVTTIGRGAFNDWVCDGTRDEIEFSAANSHAMGTNSVIKVEAGVKFNFEKELMISVPIIPSSFFIIRGFDKKANDNESG